MAFKKFDPSRPISPPEEPKRMTTYDNTNRGIISKNDRKTEDRHPDIKGQINVDGKEYWLDGWKKEGSRGPFYSLSVKPRDAKPAVDNRPIRQQVDDEIPF